MKRDKGKREGEERHRKRVGFLPSPIRIAGSSFSGCFKNTFALQYLKDDSIKGNQMSFDWIIFEILKSKSVFETPWKRVALDPNGGGEETHSFSVSLFPLPFFLCLFSYQILRERGGDSARPITGYVYGFFTKLMTYYRR